MGDIMKKILLIMLFLCSFTITINGEESIIEWPNNIVLVDVYDDINKYIFETKNKINLKKDYFDSEFYIEYNNVNYTTISTISTSILKSYTHYFKAVSPKYKISETKAFTFIIVDRESPKILSSSDIQMIIGSEKPNYKNYLSAYDNYNKPEELIITINDSLVDYKTLGIYNIIYTIKDLSGNELTHLSSLTIIDNISPVIKKTNINTYYIGDEFNIYDYFSFEDNYDKNLFITYTLSSVLENLGETTITVTAKDSSNNQSTLTKNIEIIDNLAPSITVSEEVVYLEVNGAELTLENYYNVVDNYDSFENLTIKLTNDINYQQLGKYSIKITVIDRSNNEASKEIIVFVIDSIPPQIFANDLIKETLDFDLFEGIEVEDNYNLKEEIIITVNQTNFQNKPGRYFIIYEAKDTSGNVSYLTRNIIIKGFENNLLDNTNKLIIGASLIIISGLTLLGIYLYKRKTSQ